MTQWNLGFTACCCALTVESDETVKLVAQKVFEEDLFSDGLDARQVAAYLQTCLLYTSPSPRD